MVNKQIPNINNLTPHEITIIDENGTEINIPSSGIMARVTETSEIVANINGIQVIRKSFGIVTGLPDEVRGIYNIVSVLTAQAAKNRKDLLVVGDTIRNDKGQIIGTKNLAVI